MLEGKTRIPPVDVETLQDDLRETLEEHRRLRGAPLHRLGERLLALLRAFRIPSQGFWKP
jgi:hypothetical protein